MLSSHYEATSLKAFAEIDLSAVAERLTLLKLLYTQANTFKVKKHRLQTASNMTKCHIKKVHLIQHNEIAVRLWPAVLQRQHEPSAG
jgi:hypothetical protein